MDELLWFLFAATRGGETRARILARIRQKPCNAHQLSKDLGLDYKTVQYHLAILVDNSLLTMKGGYGRVYFLSDYMIAKLPVFDSIWDRFGKK